MADYPRNTSDTTTDGILDALIDIGGKLDEVIAAIRANTTPVAIGTSQSAANGGAPGYIDPATGDVYMQKQG